MDNNKPAHQNRVRAGSRGQSLLHPAPTLEYLTIMVSNTKQNEIDFDFDVDEKIELFILYFKDNKSRATLTEKSPQ